jgi:hypothetical protein
MKSRIFTTAMFVILSLCQMTAFSQFNALTNSFTKSTDDEPTKAKQPANLISYSSTSGVECADNSFWAITGTGVDLFSINGDVITKIGTTVISGLFDQNLAYCNNLNGGAFSPTFYSTKNFDQPVYFDGSGAIASSNISPDKLINCGGNGNYLYFISYDTAFKAKAIVRYNGSAFSAIYNFPHSITATVADLAVDDYGNVWFFTGPDDETFHSDSLKVVSSGGQLLKVYPFQYETDNGYGCFLLHGKLYVGLGSYNTAHPNTVLPVTITSESAIAETPIPMTVTATYSDMASCAAGAPLSVNEPIVLKGITVYPNPVIDNLSVSSNTGESLEFILYDFMARELLHQNFKGSVTLNTGQFPKGIYAYKIRNNAGGQMTGKVVKE